MPTLFFDLLDEITPEEEADETYRKMLDESEDTEWSEEDDLEQVC